MKNNKKAQFYLFTAIILCGFALIVLAGGQKKTFPEKSFSQLDKNYIVEESKVINSGIYTNNLTDQYDDFAAVFLTYSKTKNPDFGFVYLLSTDNSLVIKNNIAKTINISTPIANFSLADSASRTINKTTFVQISFDNNKYDFNLSKEGVDSKLLFFMQSKDNIRVYQKK